MVEINKKLPKIRQLKMIQRHAKKLVKSFEGDEDGDEAIESSSTISRDRDP